MPDLGRFFPVTPDCPALNLLILLGAGGRSRTLDLRITNALLYQLSYTGRKARIIADPSRPFRRWGDYWNASVRNSVDAPFHVICTPMHSRMNADSRSSTAVPVGPSLRMIVSA